MKLSIIIPTYNRQKSLERLLDSIVKQTCSKKEFEVIVVDDGSTDQTKRIVSSFSDKLNIKYKYQKNTGIPSARNIGLKLAKSNLISFLADDYVLPENYCRKILLDFIDKDVLIVKPRIIWNNKSFLQKVANFNYDFNLWIRLEQIDVPKQFIYSLEYPKKVCWFKDYVTPAGGATFRRLIFQKYGVFDPKFKLAEDAEMGFRLYLKKVKIHMDPNINIKHIKKESVFYLIKRFFDYNKYIYYLKKKYKQFPVHNPTKPFQLIYNFFAHFLNALWEARASGSFFNFLTFAPTIFLIKCVWSLGFYYALISDKLKKI